MLVWCSGVTRMYFSMAQRSGNNDFLWNRSDPRHVKVAAVMFEHRPLKELVYVLRHYHEVLPNDITIHIFHGTSNRQNLPDIESYEAHHGKKREIIYTNTGLGNITREFYNLHMKTFHFGRLQPQLPLLHLHSSVLSHSLWV